MRKRLGSGEDVRHNWDKVIFHFCMSNIHWTCGEANLINDTIRYYDSVGGFDKSRVLAMQRFCRDYTRSGEASDIRLGVIDYTHSAHQANGTDCGVFVIIHQIFIRQGWPRDRAQQLSEGFRTCAGIDALAVRFWIGLCLLRWEYLDPSAFFASNLH